MESNDIREILERFLVELSSMTKRLLAEYGEDGELLEFLTKANRRQIPRSGTAADGLRYEVHGVGCRLWREGGPEVDFDISDDGAEIFDAWRVLTFANSIRRGEGMSLRDVQSGLQYMSESGLLKEAVSGWYTRNLS